jgi:SAM-dependent methyltransferase
MGGDGVETFRVSAAAYDGHVGRYCADLARRLIGFAGIAEGAAVLEVGAGTGLLTAELATAVGPAGRVTAVEPSAPFATACRDRVPTAVVLDARAEDLPFSDAAFDSALSQLVVNFMTDPLAGVREMSRCTRPGGVVASCVWDYAGQMTLLRAFWDAAIAVHPGAARRDEGVTMPYCDSDSLPGLWTRAGLYEVAVTELWPTATYAGFDQLWAPFALGVAPSGAFTASLDPAPRAALREEFFRRLGSPTGAFTLTARAWAVRGQVQG